MPSNPGSWMERKILPMFSRWKIARTPGIFSAAAVSSWTTRPLAMVASTGTAYSSPGNWKSEAYRAIPVTFCGPSTRGVPRPIGDAARFSCVVGMFGPSTGSGNRHLEGVREAAPGQLDLEPILALRFGVAQGGLRRLAEARLVCGLTGECTFR